MHNTLLTVTLVATGIALLVTTSAAAPFAQATDVEVKEVYHPEERPAYACWTTLWHDPAGNLHLKLAEKRRAPNPLWQPVPLEFWESIDLPVDYHMSFCNGSKDVITEFVVLESADDGATWTESGRSPTKVIDQFAWTNLPDGRIIRAIHDDDVAFDPDYHPRLRTEVSADGGTTWHVQGEILAEGFVTKGYRMRALRNGALVMLGLYGAAWGPGRPRARRNAVRAYVGSERTTGLFVSQDEGKTWSAPWTAFPGITAPEPDFVELPSGDLLLLTSTVGGSPQARQYFHKTERGFLAGPVFDIVRGTVPERVVLTQSGLLVGAIRGGDYWCSNDEGASWYKIEGLPRCNYQPDMTELSDGRLLCSWHIGGDNFFGELDQWVGTTTFRLAANLPEPTELTLTREMNESQTKYINSYVARLTAGSAALDGKTINFSVSIRYAEGYEDFPLKLIGVTNADGRARIDLEPYFVNETNIHQRYGINASFTPEESDALLTPARDSYGAYILSMSQADLNR